jgi:hypothetical protein
MTVDMALRSTSRTSDIRPAGPTPSHPRIPTIPARAGIRANKVPATMDSTGRLAPSCSASIAAKSIRLYSPSSERPTVGRRAALLARRTKRRVEADRPTLESRASQRPSRRLTSILVAGGIRSSPRSPPSTFCPSRSTRPSKGSHPREPEPPFRPPRSPQPWNGPGNEIHPSSSG